MSYSTLQDLIGTFGEDEIIHLTGGTELDEEKINIACKNADCLIDAYTFGRCNLDSENINDLIKKISVDLTIVNLSETYYNFSELPNTIIRKRRDSIALLQDLAKGKIIPGGTDIQQTVNIISNRID